MRTFSHLLCSGINQFRNCAPKLICTWVDLCRQCTSAKAKGPKGPKVTTLPLRLMPAGRGDVATSRDSTRRWEDVKCLVDIWPVLTAICARRTQKQKKSGDADKIRRLQTRAPSAPSNTGATRPFVSLSLFFGQTILRRLLPGSTYEICFALVVFCRKQTAAEFECHRTQTTFSLPISTRSPRSASRQRDCCVPRGVQTN